MEVISEVAKHGFFDKASRNLGLPDKCAWTTIRVLEAELGVVLFEKIHKNGKKSKLTEAGRNIVLYINEILHLTELIDISIKQAKLKKNEKLHS